MYYRISDRQRFILTVITRSVSINLYFQHFLILILILKLIKYMQIYNTQFTRVVHFLDRVFLLNDDWSRLIIVVIN